MTSTLIYLLLPQESLVKVHYLNHINFLRTDWQLHTDCKSDLIKKKNWNLIYSISHTHFEENFRSAHDFHPHLPGNGEAHIKRANNIYVTLVMYMPILQ
jgi:hypothetical protein